MMKGKVTFNYDVLNCAIVIIVQKRRSQKYSRRCFVIFFLEKSYQIEENFHRRGYFDPRDTSVRHKMSKL